MSLVNELIKGLLPEQEKRTVAVYGGGFKPPTAGHFEVVETALEENPEIDELIILIGGKEREGVTPEEAILIWDIYKQYLPMKVEIQLSSKPPIQAVYNYAKEHPEEDVLFILGAREGNEDDFSDIAKRTQSLDKYPNLELRTIITQGGASGTAARNAAKISLEKFKTFLPKQLKDEEVEEIYDMVKIVVTELGMKEKLGLRTTQSYLLKENKPQDGKAAPYGSGYDEVEEGRKKKKDPKKGTGKKPKKSGRRLYTDEDPKDTVGIKFSTRQDIVDTLNKKSFKAKSHARQSQIINLIHQRVRAAYGRAKDPAVKKRLKTGLDYITKKKEASKAKTQRLKKQKVKEGDTYEKMAAKGKKSGNLKQGTVRKRLNIPKGEKIPLTKINKELSRLKKMDKDKDKKGVQLGDKNQKYYKALQLSKTLKTTTNVSEQLLKEVLDPVNFDFKPLIMSLTKSMEKDGLTLKPYPKVKFIHTDFKNSDNFFGKTAYYDPGNNEVVLYTLGRHPKDILRSYAHELVHVHQNHEDRLGGIDTDNVNEDDYLEQIEREAYEEGNIKFRSWTNRITNQKDPFGLNAYARELAQLNEDEGEYYIYLDMDGVVADFDKRFEDLSGMMPQEYVDKNGLEEFWDLIDEKHKVAFWRGIELMPGAEKLVSYVSKHPFEMLTAPSIKKQSIIGKGLWIKDKVGTLYSTKPKVTYRSAKQKHTVKPNLTKFDILIDDKGSTIDRWNAAGGTAILYQSADQVINDLKELGL